MEPERHPPLSSSLLSQEHDFSSLVSWPHHWQPESFEIVPDKTASSEMIQVLPRTEDERSQKENANTRQRRTHRSNSATLSTISLACDTDTAMSPAAPGQSRPSTTCAEKSSIMTNATNNTNSIPDISNPISLLGADRQPKASMPTTSTGNIGHEKFNMPASTSTVSIANKHLIKTTSGDNMATASGTAHARDLPSAKNLSLKKKSTSFDDHRSARALGKSVLEHLVFVFPENVRRILTGPKK